MFLSRLALAALSSALARARAELTLFKPLSCLGLSGGDVVVVTDGVFGAVFERR